MNPFEEILRSRLAPKAKQIQLVEAISSGKIPVEMLMDFFLSASDTDKGTCADVIKHLSEQKPEMLAPYLDTLIAYINYRAPRVKWGIPEAIGNLSLHYPDQVVKAIPFLMENTIESESNTTVVRWCAAYSLAEIAIHNPQTRQQLLPFFAQVTQSEKNNGVKNVYLKVIKTIDKQKQSLVKVKEGNNPF